MRTRTFDMRMQSVRLTGEGQGNMLCKLMDVFVTVLLVVWWEEDEQAVRAFHVGGLPHYSWATLQLWQHLDLGVLLVEHLTPYKQRRSLCLPFWKDSTGSLIGAGNKVLHWEKYDYKIVASIWNKAITLHHDKLYILLMEINNVHWRKAKTISLAMVDMHRCGR